MVQWFKQLDRILRGEATQMALLKEKELQIPIGGISAVIVILGIINGACIGSYSAIRTHGADWNQMLASAVKFPLLFFLTLLVTLPSLYVFNALIGSNLSIKSVLRLLIATVSIMVTVVVSLGPIVVFFAICTDSYPFMKLLNVAFCAVGGFLGLAFLLRTLHRMVIIQTPGFDQLAKAQTLTAPNVASSADLAHSAQKNQSAATADNTRHLTGASPLDLVGAATHTKAKTVFKIWIIVFALVGAQMSWVLRPFIGSPNAPFEWFRARESNFFLDLVRSIQQLLGNQKLDMKAIWHTIDRILRRQVDLETPGMGAFQFRGILLIGVGFGLFYGAVMGTFSGFGHGHSLQILYSALKVPLLFGVTFLLSLPSFFIFNSLAGLRGDFVYILKALAATQAGLTIILGSLAPFTILWYLSCANYRAAILFNTAQFGLASLIAQGLLRHYYQPLIRRNPRHKTLLATWLVLFAFVGVQMGWVLRPFVGNPDSPTTFFREEAWGNAYLVLVNMVLSFF